ncbi:MAG TPA: PH domain-containing protein [Blastocatellia bacterium]|jgi:membrane protein YdbS with pleckstrin-like domain|nr:PH domain-containing protein [Blastocatellia bacterium]
MYCNQCGQELPLSSRFCNHCGASIVARDSDPADGLSQMNAATRRATAPQSRDAQRELRDDARADATYPADEDVIFTLRPTLIFVFARYMVATVIVLAVAALMGVASSIWKSQISGWVAFLVILGTGLVAFINPVYKHILRRREVYTLTNHKLEMRYGFFSKTVRNIPLRNIQDVTVRASMWQRLIKIGDIEIESASEQGKIVLDDIHYPDRYANIILGELRRRN